MSAHAFLDQMIDALLDGQEWEDEGGYNLPDTQHGQPVERRSPWSGQGSASGRAWPQGRPAPQDHTEAPEDTIRRLALQVGDLTEQVMAYQTGRAYELGFEHGALAERRRTESVRDVIRRVLACPSTHPLGPANRVTKHIPTYLINDLRKAASL